MTAKNFNRYNYLTAAVVALISAATYMLTLEPSASFWDCGEFIASSYKLEVGHPPGNPVFQLFARLFTLPFSGENAAIAVNALSGLCSAFTIFFLYLTIVFFAKRIVGGKEYTAARTITIFGAGAVGALVYAFSDTFWFSAVEGEVYAMSSLFTALVFWAMTRWYEESDGTLANRWIVLISLLMGLSIGVHLLNLLTIPALVFMYFYKKRENEHYSFGRLVVFFLIGTVILGVLNFIIIPYLPKLAAYFDLLFVNGFHLPFNSGAIFFVLLIFALCFTGLFLSIKRGHVVVNTVLLCLTSIMLGFSLFSICVIRSCAKTPTNEYQPDNPFTLVRYLSREQYGSQPLVYGQYFDAPFEARPTTYWAPLDGKYIKTAGQPEIIYEPSGKMLFPRMWSSSESHIDFYETYIPKGKYVDGAEHRKPTFTDNLFFFFDYQLNFMYWRYFMWNFVGRQNEIHSDDPSELYRGNWESGVTFLDNLRLGDQSDAPSYLKDNPGKNHYFFLPLLLGLLGLCVQCGRDPRGCWLNFLMFFMTGIAIVVYLNQPPHQVRERDYAYAGSFYFFSIWVGLGLTFITSLFHKLSEKKKVFANAGAVVLCLGIPALMACQNWDDHDRSNRRTAVEIAYNYLNSVGENGILVTHGDNDTFPVWYAQEVEGIRTDVRICNTSLLGTDWHIDQMKYACNESKPLNLTVPLKQYLYGTNEFVYIVDERKSVIPISDVMRVFKHPDAKVTLSSGERVDYIISHRISLPVNKENVLKYGILDERFKDMIPDEIILTMPDSKNYITKQELFFLDLLSNYNWDRPINFLGMGGDINIGVKEYLMYEGFSYKFVPIKTGCKRSDPGIVNPDELYDLMMNRFRWDAISRDDYFVDYQNIYTFCGVMCYRDLFATMAREMNRAGRHDDAVAILDKGQEVMKEDRFPLDMTHYRLNSELGVINMIDQYYQAGAKEKGLALATRLSDKLLESIAFFSRNAIYNRNEIFPEKLSRYTLSPAITILDMACDLISENGNPEIADEIYDRAEKVLPE